MSTRLYGSSGQRWGRSMLKDRPVLFDEARHKYAWGPTGEEMSSSVTSVATYFDDKSHFAKHPEAAARGTHIHLCLEQHLKGAAEINPGEWAEWVDPLLALPFWEQAEILASEYRMVSRRKSIGGSVDLICRYKGKTLMLDLKTSKSKPPDSKFNAQFGGYLDLLDTGDGAETPGQWIDECRVLWCSPGKTTFLKAQKCDDCSLSWLAAWDLYAAAALNTF